MGRDRGESLCLLLLLRAKKNEASTTMSDSNLEKMLRKVLEPVLERLDKVDTRLVEMDASLRKTEARLKTVEQAEEMRLRCELKRLQKETREADLPSTSTGGQRRKRVEVVEKEVSKKK